MSQKTCLNIGDVTVNFKPIVELAAKLIPIAVSVRFGPAAGAAVRIVEKMIITALKKDPK